MEMNKNENETINVIENKELICDKCNNSFPSIAVCEMHKRFCSENNNKQWNDSYTANIQRTANLSLSPRLSEQEVDEEEEDNNLRPQQSGLGYEEALALDDNVKNPLDIRILSMLPENVMDDNTLKHLCEDNKKCMICLYEFEENEIYTILPCFHYFHMEEAFTWFEAHKCCPVCREDLEKYID
jgi:hypothetical protein